MKKCRNCDRIIKDEDRYCFYCGTKIKKESYYIFFNIVIFILIILLSLTTILYVLSYFV
jgi:hypothetical protein